MNKIGKKIQKFQNQLCQSITMSAQCNATRKKHNVAIKHAWNDIITKENKKAAKKLKMSKN